MILEALLIGVGVTVLTGFRILREYERGVVFRLGRARKEMAGPGVAFLLPLGMDRMKVVDIRIKAIPIQPQEIITADNISIKVDAVVYADVKAPKEAVLAVEEYLDATMQLASTTLRGVLGRMDLDEILSKRDKINEEIRSILDQRTEQWGVEISAVELRDIVLPQEMKRAMARQAEAERERRAKVIAAQGEEQAARTLAAAAEVMAVHPGAMQLRLYQTLVEVSVNQNTTVVLPVPMEMLGQGSANMGPYLAQASSLAGAKQVAAAPPPPRLEAPADLPVPTYSEQGEVREAPVTALDALATLVEAARKAQR
ncbi:MAG: slipin family protein [Deltaproteobacteria bacterium]|nr:slipin family protein [Deltaproteobacteria bacterium]